MKEVKKLYKLPELKKVLAKEKKKIVVLSGSFDLFHGGHVDLLRNAKAQGDILVVLLNSDKSISGYKGSSRPFFNEWTRLEILKTSIFVDYICLFDELTPLKVLEQINFNVYVNGSDYGKNFIEKDIVVAKGAKIYSNKRLAASSDLVSSIKNEKAPNKAVFLDRDGVLIHDKNYLYKVEDVEFMDGIFETLKLIQSKGYLLIGISNQSGIGRKMFKKSDTDKVNQYIIDKLAEKGVDLKEIDYCPHAPEHDCDCRKPKSKMFLDAAKKYNVALGRSFMIGDKLSDIEAGKILNAKGIFVGKLPKKVRSVEYPDFVVNKISEIQKIFK